MAASEHEASHGRRSLQLDEMYISIRAASGLLGECWDVIKGELQGRPNIYLKLAGDNLILPVRILRQAFPGHPLWLELGIGKRLPPRLQPYLRDDAAAPDLSPRDASIVAFTRAYGTLPDQASVSHTCQDDRCADPRHLYVDVPTHKA
ncbi:MAG TPA: HNH endonuclease [Ktedonobacterales bacterium]